jgi:hypothetical protein
MVSINSALGRHEDPAMTLSFAPSRQWVTDHTNHWELLSRPAVYAQVKDWMASPRKASTRSRVATA